VIIAFGFVLSGCVSNSGSDLESIPSVVIDTTVAHLTDTVGNPDKVKVSATLPRERALTAPKDYHPMTGKWV
jgi:hypothetical protein